MPLAASSPSSPVKKQTVETRDRVNHLNLQTLLDGVTPFLGEELSQLNTVHQKISMKNFAEDCANVLMSHYKIQDQDIIHTAALAM